MIKPGPGAAELDIYQMLVGLDGAADAWRRYVEAVRASAEDDDDEFQIEAQDLLDDGLDEATPPEEEDLEDDEPFDDDADPEGYGMDEPAEGAM